MGSLDLRPYHIDLVLTKDSMALHHVNPSLFERGQLYIRHITLGRKEYEIEKELGRGTFGVTYLVRSAEGDVYACKVMKNVTSNSQRVAFFKECLINIILAEESKGEENGPYVPRIYRIAYDEIRHQAFILSEVMHNTLDNVISAFSPKENDIIVPDALNKIAKILDFFARTVRFNHRDLKGDNIMYVKNAAGERLYRLIDFGFTCITWKGIRIEGIGYFENSPRCFKEDRDLSQLVYSILRYSGTHMTHKLYNYLANIIVANVGRHKCRMEKDCPMNGLRGWRNTYNFLERDNVSVPKAEPTQFMEELGKYGKKTRKMPRVPPAVAGECPPGKIRNPKTGRCVKDTGAIGKKLKAPLEAPSPCPPGKIRNPKTRRCVKETGAVGKLLMADK